MKEMAREELQENETLQPQIEEKIKMLLVPKDPEDAKNVQMEIRAGAGGDEAALFAGDLFNMYKRYSDTKGWNLSITDISEGAVGGYKEIDFVISGADVYGTIFIKTWCAFNKLRDFLHAVLMCSFKLVGYVVVAKLLVLFYCRSYLLALY